MAAVKKRTSQRCPYNAASSKERVFARFKEGRFPSEIYSEFPELKPHTVQQYYYSFKKSLALQEAIILLFIDRAKAALREFQIPVEREVFFELEVSLVRFVASLPTSYFRPTKEPDKLLTELVLRWKTTLLFKREWILSVLDAQKGKKLFDQFCDAVLQAE